MDPSLDNADEEQLASQLREAFRTEQGEVRDFTFDGPRFRGSSGSAMSALGDAAGLRLGDFQLVSELGRGGMGIVYRARQLSLNREVAVKVLPSYAQRGRLAIQRFRTEAQAAARLHHTNIVPIYAHGEDGGRFYYAMELIEGASLDAAIRTRSRVLCPSNTHLPEVASIRSQETIAAGSAPDFDVPPAAMAEDASASLPALARTRDDYRQVARLFAEVAEALAHAHAQGVIHRDIKPQNLLVDRSHRLHVTDFGLARLADGPALTMTGEVMGTPAYLSPEQVEARQDAIDHRTDIYSLGATLYEVLALRPPFVGETRHQVMNGIRTSAPILLRRFDRHLPKDLETICLKALEKEPDRRFATAADMAADLRRFCAGRPIRSRPVGLVGRGIKWSRRHRALTTALVLSLVALLLAGGLGLTVRQARQDRAANLLSEARHRLVFLDYRSTDRLEARLDDAEELGADPIELARLRGLMAFAANEPAEAYAHLDSILADRPADVEALYLLATAQERDNQVQKAAQSRAAADEIGPSTAAEWFLRGLAYRWHDPAEAIRSYEEGRRLRLQDGEVFLQATLHAARARNQRMYAERSLDDFASAEEALRQLIDLQVYGSYPYYLLSTTHRLAGEIYAGSEGTREGALAAAHLEKALELARAGATVEPNNPSPHSAEAFALESMGRWAEAIAAHTASIELSAGNVERLCEAHHYRWRLHFWLGNYEAALSDVNVHKACSLPEPEFMYSRAFPALIHAAQGDLGRARQEALAITTDHPRSALAVIWTASWLRLLGRAAEAERHLAAMADSVDFSAEIVSPQTPQWVEALYEQAWHGTAKTRLAELADAAPQPWRLRGEADFHEALRVLGEGDRATAEQALLRSYRSFDSELRYTFAARLLREMLREDPQWPPWIAAEGLDLEPADDVEG
jgi:serine/threonine protein kinase/Flp pilus assembly protein TadD